jgi:Zn-dependent M28 family amino/carboxypeptidase
MHHVRRLANEIGIRVRARKGEYRGSRYIARRFRRLGYDVKIQKFSVDSDTSRNVVARPANTVAHPFVIGAHMDTVPGSHGANDNASGVAVILDIARIVAGTDKARFIKFIAFGAEEYGEDGRHHVGSQVHVNRLSNRSVRRMPGMISVDMIADGSPLIVGTAGIGPDVVARTLYRRIKRAGISVRYRTTCDCSDNGPFELAGIPAAFMWSGPDPDYHSPSDVVKNMNPDHVRRTGRAVRVFVKAMSTRMLRRFRQH